MEDTLKRLLAAEDQANNLTQVAQQQADALVQQTREEVKNNEQRLAAHIPDIRASFIEKSNQRAQQSIQENQRRYEEYISNLRNVSEQYEEEALETAFDYLLNPK